ncbi:CLUMA_CG003278, isoform A, partial [Clunio marinus]
MNTIISSEDLERIFVNNEKFADRFRSVAFALEEDGTLLLSTIQSVFNKSESLNFRDPISGKIFPCDFSESRFHPPENGWSSEVIYVSINRKRKRDTCMENVPEPNVSRHLPQPKKTFFPRESVQVGWNNIGRKWSPGCGFVNTYNTCYLNSALQALFHIPALSNWLIADKDNCNQDGQICIICAMSQTLISSQRQQHSMIPSLIINRLQTICPHFITGRQEDAQEFIQYLVEQMEKAYLNRSKAIVNLKELDHYSKETTPLSQILGGYICSTVTCLACKHESITFQYFKDLQLDITRASTLDEALTGYFSRENLEKCGYECESCKRKVSATKRFSLERAPVVLCIQLKRFNVMGGKLDKQIQISQNMDLQKHLAKSCDPTQSCYYRLVSLVTHLGGSASGGHYTAIGLTPYGNYYEFDDSCVYQISTESDLCTNAYLLFYELLTKQKNKATHQGSSYEEVPCEIFEISDNEEVPCEISDDGSDHCNKNAADNPSSTTSAPIWQSEKFLELRNFSRDLNNSWV